MAKEKIEPELVEHSGLGRVKLDFSPSNQSFKVPPGVSVFDAASWNGIAIDSTCGGHGTCKKCKVQITEGIVPISRLDIRAFSQEELKKWLALGMCCSCHRKLSNHSSCDDHQTKSCNGRSWKTSDS